MSHLRRALPYAIVASVVAALSVWMTASASPMQGHRQAAILRIDSHDTSANFHFAAKTGVTAGDSGVFTGNVFSVPGRLRIGTDEGVCDFVTAKRLQCDIVVSLGHRNQIDMTGSLSVCGLCSATKGVNVLAVTGGTGRFSMARGWVVDRAYSHGNKDHLTIQLQ